MIYNIIYSIAYVTMLLWIYDAEFTFYWAYMRFGGVLDSQVIATALLLSVVLAVMLPTKRSARGFILVILHYFSFLPSIVYLAFNDHHPDYFFAVAIAAFCIYIGSMLPVRTIAVPPLRRITLLSIVVFLICLALALQVAFGGLNQFNLNMEAVYEFRTEAAAAMPAIFGYIYSNVANVLIPSSIALAMHLRSRYLAYMGVLASVFLFGMTQHKSIIFVSLMVLGLYIAFQRNKNLPSLAFLPISLVFVCVVEVVYYIYVAPDRHPGLITSYFVRRSLFVPPMLDASSVELFNEVAKYYWSTSRLGLGIISNPHGIPAPFLMGIHFFDDVNMSANPGNIGSGYSHAGLWGVLVYSILTGILISFINTVGRKVGHSLSAAMSIPIIHVIVTSTDLTTAILSHGLSLLVIVLVFLPRQIATSPYAENRSL